MTEFRRCVVTRGVHKLSRVSNSVDLQEDRIYAPRVEKWPRCLDTRPLAGTPCRPGLGASLQRAGPKDVSWRHRLAKGASLCPARN